MLTMTMYLDSTAICGRNMYNDKTMTHTMKQNIIQLIKGTLDYHKVTA